MDSKALRIDPDDNVAVALRDLAIGETIKLESAEITLVQEVGQKHKFSLHALGVDDEVRMYGVPVGRVTKPIPKGGRVGTHNIVHHVADYEIAHTTHHWSPPEIDGWSSRTWQGYHRSNGEIGTANHWIVVPLVFCENRNVDVLRESLLDQLGYAIDRRHGWDISNLIEAYHVGVTSQEIRGMVLEASSTAQSRRRPFKNIDGIKFLKHDMGCGGTREDSATLCNLLAGYITHPNVGGATILSLGCQNAQIADLKEAIERRYPQFDRPVLYFEQQGEQTERAFMAEVVKETFLGLMDANRAQRAPAPLSKLVLGLECGGSDGFSGLSANPALGHTSDLIVALGGRTILAEFPELNGVEQELINRCVNHSNAEKFSRLMKAYHERARAVGSGFESNPSPGNIRDGLITDAIKSAGAAKKGGTSPVQDVLDYTEPASKPGLNLLCTPGGDVESTTGLAGSGANVIVFTTGLGTPTGNAIAPVLKMSTNNDLYNRMGDILDINAGAIIDGSATIEEIGARLLDLVIETASGTYEPAAVRLGQDDFIPWKRGISL